jgi:hypothetical protein
LKSKELIVLGEWNVWNEWNGWNELTLFHYFCYKRYMLDNSTWAEDSSKDQYIKGFANLTKSRNAPIFLSNPHYFGADDVWRSKVQGMAAPDPIRDQVRFIRFIGFPFIHLASLSLSLSLPSLLS